MLIDTSSMPYGMGYQAAADGIPRENCPYVRGSHSRREWLAGWDAWNAESGMADDALNAHVWQQAQEAVKQLAEVRGERDMWKEQYDLGVRVLAMRNEALGAATQRAEQAERALREYGEHKPGCHDHPSVADGPWGSRLPCNCGFDAALAVPAPATNATGEP